ncbi:InlB B-repeat-containing protein, partial [Candidatus Saccharibacteria bacterium]|nr:InlB B-repeat-containing protein [Candidatus Saccharibacteria bacterium]
MNKGYTRLLKVYKQKIANNYFRIRGQKMRMFGIASSFFLIIFGTLALFPVVPKQEAADAATGTATESSPTVSVSTATASVDLTATSTDGTFATSTGSGIASFDVTTTNFTGYTLTINASDDAGTLTNGSGGSFTSISQVLDEKTFDSSTYNGYWGYKPSKYNSVDNVAYWPSPTTHDTTLDVTDEANSTANTYTIALGARASASQAAGTYSKTVTITATANPSAYSITYTDNTGDSTVTNIPDSTSSTTDATSITLSSVTPSRTGYVFNGWCSVAPTNSGQSCSGTTYAVSGSYVIDQTTENITTLYATWTVPKYTITIVPGTGVSSVLLNSTRCTDVNGCTVSNLTYGQSYTLTATAASGYTFSGWYVDGLGNVTSSTTASTSFTVGQGAATITASAIYTMPAGTTMQGFTSAMCASMPIGQAYPLTDTRDNTMYMVARLADNRCWMLQNLKLGSKTATMTLSGSDTNIAVNGSFELTNRLADGKFPYNTISEDPVTGQPSYYYDSQAYYCTDNYGCYYNNYTATAGSMTSSTGAGTTVNYSICPKGWSLPTGGSGGE